MSLMFDLPEVDIDRQICECEIRVIEIEEQSANYALCS